MSLQQVPKNIVPTVIEGATTGIGFTAGVTAGLYLVNAINTAAPQATVNLTPTVKFGLGDVAAIVAGTALGVLTAKGKNDHIKTLTKTAAYGLATGVVINKIAQATGYPAPFQSILPAAAPAAYAGSYPLFQGRVVPSSAYSSRSYQLNVA